MKKQARMILVGAVMTALLLTGCGNKGETAEGQQTGENAVPGPAETTESPAEEETKAAVDGPYVLVRESVQRNGMVIEYDYDENGDMTRATNTYKEAPGDTFYREYTTQYKEDGSKIVTKSQAVLEATGEVIDPDSFEYEYDPEGRLVRETGLKNGEYQDEITYEYDENGNLIAQSEGKPGDGVTSLARQYEYDDAGNRIKEIEYDLDGNINQYFTYEYDENGKETVKRNFNPEGEEMIEAVRYQWQYEYDSQGRVTGEWKESVEGGRKSEEYLYAYDEYGNMCEKTDVFQDTTYEYQPLSVYLEENGR